MNEVITIENTEMQIKEYNGQRVVTFKDIDTVHQRPTGTARRSFNKNKKHFIEGEDYIKICVDEIRTHKIFDISNKARADIVVLTESGYLMITKSLTDDLSWNVQRQLVNAYFRVKNLQEELVTLAELENLRNEHPKYLTSSTPVPKNPSWYERNRRRINFICEVAKCKHSKLYHHVLVRLSEEYDIDEANRIYELEIGHKPQYAIDIVSYFPELGRLADEFLDKLEKCARQEVDKR